MMVIPVQLIENNNKNVYDHVVTLCQVMYCDQ